MSMGTEPELGRASCWIERTERDVGNDEEWALGGISCYFGRIFGLIYLWMPEGDVLVDRLSESICTRQSIVASKEVPYWLGT